MSLLITDAGIAASIRAGKLGIEYAITHISIGTEGYVPTAGQTALRNEVLRKAITKGEVIALGQLHFETVWDGAESFEGKELAYWLEDGTLFAVDSRNGEVITYKRKDTVVTESCELSLVASAIDNITVKLLDAPTATESRFGVAKIATESQVSAGTDDSAFLTIKKLLQRVASTAKAGVVQLSNQYNGSSQTKATTEKALSDGLRTKSNAVHTHSASDINVGILAQERLPTASVGVKGAVPLSNSYVGTSQTKAVTEKALSEGLEAMAAKRYRLVSLVGNGMVPRTFDTDHGDTGQYMYSTLVEMAAEGATGIVTINAKTNQKCKFNHLNIGYGYKSIIITKLVLNGIVTSNGQNIGMGGTDDLALNALYNSLMSEYWSSIQIHWKAVESSTSYNDIYAGWSDYEEE